MDVCSDVDATRSILVAVITVGKTPPQGMGKYMSMLKRNRRHDLSTITLPAHNPFKNVCRQSDYILLNFTDNPNISGSSFDTMFLYRQTLAVIGFIHCPSNPDLDLAYQDFVAQIKGFPRALQMRCLAVEPLDSQQDLAEREGLIMVPNSDTQHFQFYLSTIIVDFAERLVCDMLEAARAIPSYQEFPYISLDKPFLQQDSGKRKKYLPGRILKLNADYSMLCGIVTDAKMLFQASIETTKSSGDFIWRGAALEGLAFCEYNASFDSRVTLIEKAIRNYARKPGTDSLRVEALMKLGRLACNHGHVASSLEYLSRAYELCSAIPIADKTAVAVESAILCHAQGAKRKFAMFLRNAAVQYTKMKLWPQAYQALRLCAPVYGIDSKPIRSSWSDLQIAVLTQLIISARGVRNLPTECQYMSLLLPRIHSAEEQKSIVSQFCNSIAVLSKTQMISIPGIPQIQSLELLKPSGGFISRTRSSKLSHPAPDESTEDLFLFRPAGSFMVDEDDTVLASRQVHIPLGQAIEFDLTLHNPLLIDLSVSLIAVHGQGTAYESLPVSVSLSPLKSKTIRTTIVPLSQGLLVIDAVLVRVCNVETFHDVTEISVRPISVDVCAPMPVLKVAVQPLNMLYFGQIVTIPIVLRNAGFVNIHDIDLRFAAADSTDRIASTIQLPEDTVVALTPGQVCTIEAEVNCCKEGRDYLLLVVRYAQSLQSDLYRECIVRVPFSVASGLSIRSLDIYPFAQHQQSGVIVSDPEEGALDIGSFGPENCMIVAEIVNTAAERFAIGVSESSSEHRLSFNIDSIGSENIILPFRRRSFGDPNDDALAALGIDPSSMYKSDFDDSIFVQFRQKFIESIAFEWKILGSHPLVHGFLPLPSCLITPSHLRHIIPDPFKFQFELTGSCNPSPLTTSTYVGSTSPPVSPCLHIPNFRFDTESIEVDFANRFYPRGKFTQIKIVVISLASHPMNMSVTVRPSYEASTGQFEYDLRHRLLWTGSWDHALGTIDPGASATLQLNICFLAVGRFMFQLICQCEQSQSTTLTYSSSLPLVIEAFDKQLVSDLVPMPSPVHLVIS